MSRALDAGSLAAIQDDQDLEMFHLVTMYFTATDRMTDHPHDISYNFGAGSETFTSTARLVSISPVAESQDINNPTITIALSGASTSDIAVMETEDYTNVRVIIRRGFFNSTGETTDSDIVGKPFTIFDGKVSSWSFADNPYTGESQINWEVTSHWADWERTNGRKSNNESAQTNNNNEFSSDESFSYIYDQIGDRQWGKISA